MKKGFSMVEVMIAAGFILVGVGLGYVFFNQNQPIINPSPIGNSADISDSIPDTNTSGLPNDTDDDSDDDSDDAKDGQGETDPSVPGGGEDGSKANKGVTLIRCTTEQRRADGCFQLYQPVCGIVEVSCVTTPCPPIKETFSNSCEACRHPQVEEYIAGECQ